MSIQVLKPYSDNCEFCSSCFKSLSK